MSFSSLYFAKTFVVVILVLYKVSEICLLLLSVGQVVKVSVVIFTLNISDVNFNHF